MTLQTLGTDLLDLVTTNYGICNLTKLGIISTRLTILQKK